MMAKGAIPGRRAHTATKYEMPDEVCDSVFSSIGDYRKHRDTDWLHKLEARRQQVHRAIDAAFGAMMLEMDKVEEGRKLKFRLPAGYLDEKGDE